jgi:hypothetical protein
MLAFELELLITWIGIKFQFVFVDVTNNMVIDPHLKLHKFLYVGQFYNC